MKERLEAVIERAQAARKGAGMHVGDFVKALLAGLPAGVDEDHVIAAMNEVIEWADQFIKAVIEDPLVCEECGSEEVSQTAWIDINGYHIRENDSPPDDRRWCELCSHEVSPVLRSVLSQRRDEKAAEDPRKNCKHELDITTVHYADGTEDIINILCKKCGKSGSLAVVSADVNW